MSHQKSLSCPQEEQAREVGVRTWKADSCMTDSVGMSQRETLSGIFSASALLPALTQTISLCVEEKKKVGGRNQFLMQEVQGAVKSILVSFQTLFAAFYLS